MKNMHHLVSVKTMTDYHLESFIRCPYKFYYQYIVSANFHQVRWRQAVQFIVNQVVQKYYQLPLHTRNKINILKLIDKYWKGIDLNYFESKIDYYIILAKTTDHLLQFLMTDNSPKPPLFLYEKLNTYIEELETQLSVTFELAEWSTDSFVIKKYLIEADEEMTKLYNYLIVVFSNQAFGKLPEKIEIITLLEGKKYTYFPKNDDVKKGIVYLKHMKSLLQHPDGYIKTNLLRECMSCPFTQRCKESSNEFEEVYKLTNNLLH
ncbi:hypothetical protein [Metabacillus fastidiosus]|uniref:hypothetical protein n=1 Tax=Metabacillus fastidiosus TaxID=1458 RepID=UPI002E2450C6|nr:hypothetical protein [Metabacillus fastidiosus]